MSRSNRRFFHSFCSLSSLHNRRVSPRIKCGALNHALYLAFQFGASMQLLTFTLAGIVSLVLDINVNMDVVAVRKFRDRGLAVSSEIF